MIHSAVIFGAIVFTLQYRLASASIVAFAFALEDAAKLDGATWFPL